MRRQLVAILSRLLREAGAPDSWLGPCRRLALAVFFRQRALTLHRSRWVLGWWTWRVRVLTRRCRDLRSPSGMCASDFAYAAATELLEAAGSRFG